MSVNEYIERQRVAGLLVSKDGKVVVGTLLRSAIGNNLSTYLSEKIWRPYGMGADAYWRLTEPGGGEFGGCCISATLRDYGRLGLFALDNGVLNDDTRVLPERRCRTKASWESRVIQH